MPRFIEVSHVIEPGMVTYPGLPVPEAKVIVDHDSSRERYQNKLLPSEIPGLGTQGCTPPARTWTARQLRQGVQGFS
jgi:hypothetical protein